MAKTVVVLGARNLGGAIVEHFLGLGWNTAAVARSEETLERIRGRGALALSADASDHAALTQALAQARRELGSVDAVVHAVSASRPPSSGPFGGGELEPTRISPLHFCGWTVAVAEQAFVFLPSTGAAALKETGAGALVQITGGSSRRAMAGRGLWAAGAFATRALVQAAAQGAAWRGNPRRAAGGRRDDRITEDRGLHERPAARGTRGHGRDRQRGPVPRRSGGPVADPRPDGHSSRRPVGAVGGRRRCEHEPRPARPAPNQARRGAPQVSTSPTPRPDQPDLEQVRAELEARRDRTRGAGRGARQAPRARELARVRQADR